MKFSSIDYFEKQPTGSFYTINEVIRDKSHPYNEVVMHDLNSIPNEILDEWAAKKRVERLISSEVENKDLAVRSWFLEHSIGKEIAIKRLNLLKDTLKDQRPMPYDLPELFDLTIDENGLANLKDFDCSNFGLGYKNEVYQLCPSLEQFNSCHWLFNILVTEEFRNNKNFKIRLDPLVKVPKDIFRPYFQHMVIYGKTLDWENLKKLKVEEFGQWMGDDGSTPSIRTTDYVWSPSKDEVHFTCEELPKLEYLELRGSRYFHAIFDKKTGKIIHCDGAIRIYNHYEYTTRLNFHVRQPEVRKIGKRVKIFQIDDSISHDLFMKLATNFLVWNQDAIGYFN